MSTARARPEIPTWVTGLGAVLFLATFLYGLIIMRQLLLVLLFWLGIAGVGLALYTVTLLYRLVVAAETIAEEL
jgi:hypothetical protein